VKIPAKALTLAFLFVPLVFGAASAQAKKGGSMTVYKFKANSIEGKEVSLSSYEGKAMLIVNVASRCGFTPQYEGLEKIYVRFKGKGFEVLGFPCNQFGSQEPGTEAEIKTFCETKYHVTFPLFSKIDVNGANAHPLYKFLKNGKEIGWNFTKFLIDRHGHLLKRYDSGVTPENLEKDIQKTLSAK